MQVIEHLAHFKKTYLTILLFLFCLIKTSAQVFPDTTVHRMMKAGITFIVNQDYDKAEIVFTKLDDLRKDLPFGKIYLAATLIAKSYDYQEPYDDENISRYLEEAESNTKKLLSIDNKNIWNHYYYALTEGYSAYYDALNENWLSAFSKGLNSIGAFQYCLDKNDNFYESLIALGSYKFWRSKKTEFLNWLPFVPNEEQLGIDYLKKAIQHPSYNLYLAIHSLIWIYIEQNDFNSAINTATDALKINPDSRLFKWGLARAYENINPEKSITLYTEILNSYPKDLKSNKVNEVTLKHIIAQLLVKLGRKGEALNLCNEILAINDYTQFESDKLGKRLDRVRELTNELNNDR
jgi:tetratricopeptide (TPR) repeat protein